MADSSVRFFVGIDWATEQHQVCIVEPTGRIVIERVVPHTGDGLSDLADLLSKRVDGDVSSVFVALETPHGAVVDTLLERGFTVFSLNPKQLDRFRDRHTVAGAKDDRRDAFVLADSLRTDGPKFRRLAVDEPAVIQLREWSRILDDLRQDHVRSANRVRQQLRRYHVAPLALSDDVGAEWMLDLLELAPTPAKAGKVTEKEVASILKARRIRKVTAAEVVSTLSVRSLFSAPGTAEAAAAHLRLAIERIRLTNAQIRQAERRLDELIEELAGPEDAAPGQKNEQSDAAILLSLPGVGRIVVAALLAEAARPLRDRDYRTLRSLCGVAPVTKQSGKSARVIMRKACQHRLRNACYHWGRVAVQNDPDAKAAYAHQRARGHSHGRAVRGVVDRCLRTACAMLRNGTRFDPSRRSRQPAADARQAGVTAPAKTA